MLSHLEKASAARTGTEFLELGVDFNLKSRPKRQRQRQFGPAELASESLTGADGVHRVLRLGTSLDVPAERLLLRCVDIACGADANCS